MPASRSLAQVLLRNLLLAYVALAIGILGFQLTVEYRSYRQGVIDTLRSQANTFAPGAAAALWEYQRSLLQSMVNGISMHPAVFFVEIKDNEESLSASWRASGKTSASPDLQVQQPLYVTGNNGTRKSVGTLTIASSEEHIWRHLRDVFFPIILTDAALLFSLGLVLWMLVHRLAVRPLARFSSQVNELVGHVPGRPIDLGRTNVAEMITLQQGFNLLMQQIGESHARIAEQNAWLEQKVFERTRELEHNNRELVDAIARQKELTDSLKEAQIIANLGSYVLDLATGVFKTSDGLDRLFGIDETYDRSVAGWLARIHPADRAPIQDYLRNEVIGQARGFDKAYRIIRHDDRAERWLHGLGKLDFGKDGRPVKMHGTVQDITDRVQAEERLLNSLRQLEEKELAKTRFLAAAGHDLRQPVAAANLFLDALKFTSPTERQVELIGRLDQSMTTFADLLEQLLDISKFDAGVIKLRVTSFHLADLFGWIEHNFAQTARDKGLRFLLRFPMNKSLLVRSDIGLLQSVLMNLVSNAIKFTTRGGVLVGARQRGDRLLIQVWDTGIGIAEADLARIFDEFFQVANPQRSREAGLGLGLSICKRAGALLECHITCRSHAGRGSVFELSLPLADGRRHPDASSLDNVPASAGAEIQFKGKRVVVVEDDTLVAAGMVTMFDEVGAVVRHFQKAEDALRHDDIADADFFVVDYALGGTLNGLQLLEALQQRNSVPICAVVVTGETSSEFISSVAGCPWPVMHKPVSYATIVSALRSNRVA